MVKLQELMKSDVVEVMSNRVEIYVPSTINSGGITKKQAALFSWRMGGDSRRYTASPQI